MNRKYDMSLLAKLKEREVEGSYKGAKIIIKRIPDCDEQGAMDPRLYHDMKKQFAIMKLMPKSMKEKELKVKDLVKMRKMFDEKKSIPIVTSKIDIRHITIPAKDSYNIPARIYRNEKTQPNTPVLYYIHGGGFFAGNLDVVEESMKLFVEKTNVCVISIDYRLAPEHPFPIGHEDCYSGLKWIYEHHEEFAIDPTRIFVGGDSAGGNLTQYCTTRSYEDGKEMVKGQLLLYPTLNMCKVEDAYFKWSIDEFEFTKKQKAGLETMLHMFQNMGGGLEGLMQVETAQNDYLNPYTRDPKHNPPTFISVGEHDYLKVESLSYAAKLTDAGVATKTILYKGFGHAYLDNCGVYPQCEDCIEEMGKFINEYTK